MKYEFIEDIPASNKFKFTSKKKRCQDLTFFLEYYANEHVDKWITAMESCASFWEGVLTSGKELKTTRTTLCKSRICSVCTHVKARQSLERLKFRIATFSNPRFIFLTLTVPNCTISYLRTTSQEMARGWNRMAVNLLKKNTAVLGYVRGFEVTRNAENNTAHPHYHVLLHVSPSYFGVNYITREAWLSMWKKAIRNPSITQVDVRAVKDGNDDALLELCKYDLKAKELADISAVKEENRDELGDWLCEYMRQLKRVRRFSSSGSLKLPGLDEVKESAVHKDKLIAWIKAWWVSDKNKYKISAVQENLPNVDSETSEFC